MIPAAASTMAVEITRQAIVRRRIAFTGPPRMRHNPPVHRE
jgi:hypothetical protein